MGRRHTLTRRQSARVLVSAKILAVGKSNVAFENSNHHQQIRYHIAGPSEAQLLSDNGKNSSKYLLQRSCLSQKTPAQLWRVAHVPKTSSGSTLSPQKPLYIFFCATDTRFFIFCSQIFEVKVSHPGSPRGPRSKTVCIRHELSETLLGA